MSHRADIATEPAGHPAAGGEAAPARAGHDLAAAALALAIAAAVARMLPDGPVRLTLLLAFMLAGPGAAFVSHLTIRDRVLALAMTLTASLSIGALTAGGMVWVAWWHPDVLTVLMISLTAATALARLVGWTPQQPGRQLAEEPRSPEAAPAHGVRMVSAALSPVLLVVALAIWAVTVARSDSGQVGDYGLTAGLGVPFVAGLAMTCLAFGIELFGRVRVGVLTAGVGAAALQVFGTAPLLLSEPEYAWTYKHLGVVELIQQHGRALDSKDIYQQWPGFFASVAQLSTVSGVAAIRFATWSSLFFALLDAVLLAAAARALTTDRRVVFLTVFLFECCLWVDQNYFSPQAFAYALSLGFFAILLHWCRGEPTKRWPWLIGRLQGMLVRQAPPAVDVRGGAARLRVIGVVGVFAAITVSHQLTPYLLMFGVGTLTVLGLIRPYWLMALLAVVAGGYFLPRLSGVSSQYHLFDGFDLFKNASGNASGWGSDAQRFSAMVARLLAFAVWGSTLVAAWRHRRRLGRVVIGLVLGFSPFLLLGLQNYGGEAIYRVFLFSLPWCALLAAGWWGRFSLGRLHGVASGVIFTVLALAALQGLQGQFALHVVPPADIRAAKYLAAQAPAGSTMVMVAASFPARLTANYADLNPGRSVDPSIVDQPDFQHLTLDSSELPAIESWAAGYGGTETFLVVSGQMAKTAEYFGQLTSGSVKALRKALDTSDRWSVYYRSSDVTIYRLEPDL